MLERNLLIRYKRAQRGAASDLSGVECLNRIDEAAVLMLSWRLAVGIVVVLSLAGLIQWLFIPVLGVEASFAGLIGAAPRLMVLIAHG